MRLSRGLDDFFCRVTKTHQEIGRTAILASRGQGFTHATHHKVFDDLLATLPLLLATVHFRLQNNPASWSGEGGLQDFAQ
jgi:hypothetical protein